MQVKRVPDGGRTHNIVIHSHVIKVSFKRPGVQCRGVALSRDDRKDHSCSSYPINRLTTEYGLSFSGCRVLV